MDPLLRLRRPDPARDARHVRAHYDLGNEFFARLLDETMAYSCAVFDRPGMSLADASRSKFDRLARSLDLTADDQLLEIGTGWAGFAIHVAQRYGCRVTTTTVSAHQFEHARAAVAAAGLADRITVLDADYRDLRGTFDKAIAIEMIEAVDWRDYETFFSQVRGVLADDGAFAMQAIVAADESFDRLKRHADFIKAAIFPGGCLPSVRALTTVAQSTAGLALTHRDDIGPHYAETLRRWRTNLDDHDARAPAPRSRRTLRSVVALLPRVLRGRLRRALHRRGAAAATRRRPSPPAPRPRGVRRQPRAVDERRRRPWSRSGGRERAVGGRAGVGGGHGRPEGVGRRRLRLGPPHPVREDDGDRRTTAHHEQHDEHLPAAM